MGSPQKVLYIFWGKLNMKQNQVCFFGIPPVSCGPSCHNLSRHALHRKAGHMASFERWVFASDFGCMFVLVISRGVGSEG